MNRPIPDAILVLPYMPVNKSSADPVIRGVRYFLTHAPGMVQHGSKPSRDLLANPGLSAALASHLRSFQQAAAYLPNRAFLGEIYPPDLARYPRPWFSIETSGETSIEGDASRWMPHGELMPEEEFYGLIKMCDVFDLVWLEEGFAKEAAAALAEHPLVTESEVQPMGEGRPYSEIEARIAQGAPSSETSLFPASQNRASTTIPSWQIFSWASRSQIVVSWVLIFSSSCSV